MRRETLLDFFDDLAGCDGAYLTYDDGLRTRGYTYVEVARGARAFAGRLRAAGILPGDKVVLWGENRPEWVTALWGCLLAGAVAVPVDYRSSADLLRRVVATVAAKVVLTGAEVEAGAVEGPPVWPLVELDVGREAAAVRVEARRGDVAEILFTSGATAEPKGVVITHGNILANIVPVEQEVHKYRRYGRPFFPVRFLNLLPLSHLFGQTMAAFIPPMLPGEVIFVRGHNPREIVEQIRRRRVSVLVAVPKMLELLRDYLIRLDPELQAPPPAGEHWVRRWWRYRQVHRRLGWKFWAFVVGAAPLPAELEEFWSRLGYVVIQGYGLTETAPIVTLNHPFHARKGSVGKPVAGVEVSIAADGEILVRGENVTAGYWRGGEVAGVFGEDGWFHTGDIGSLDGEGRLAIRGRKKEMIVTPDGLNVFPDDVEAVVKTIAGVRDVCVVGRDRVHAVLRLEEGAIAETVVRTANTSLEDHQRIHGWSLWTDGELPRTEGTQKLKRGEVQAWVDDPTRVKAPREDARWKGLPADASLDDLGLSSLERVELMVELGLEENQFQQAKTVGALRRLSEESGAVAAAPAPPLEFARWARGAAARAFRRLFLPGIVLPLTRAFAWIRVEGREHVEALNGPVLFASNHQSYMDTPAILAALPRPWRYRVAPAMRKEYFDGHPFQLWLAELIFNGFRIPQRSAGALDALRYAGELASDGWSVLIYPEGEHTESGAIGRFQAGVGMMAARLRVPVVPVRLEGLDRVLHRTWKMARPGRVTVRFGAPLLLAGGDYAALARQVEEAVRTLGRSSTPRP